MKLFFILVLGRSGNNFPASLLARDPRTRVHDEAEPGNPKLLAFRHAGATSHFQRLWWYWQHKKEMLASRHPRLVQLERVLRDHDCLREGILEPTGVRFSQQQWGRAVNRRTHTSEQNCLQRLLCLWIPRGPRYREVPPIPHWSNWDPETTERFWDIRGPTIEKMGYGASQSRDEPSG